MKIKSALYINGSTRPGKTTSDSIARFMISQFEPMGVAGHRYQVSELIRHPETFDTVVQILRDTDLLIMVIPLNVDSLSYPTILLMERLAALKDTGLFNGKKMAGIVHSGYPEHTQRQPSIDICHCFSEEMGMEWLGGIGFGGTSLIGGRDLQTVGFLTKGMRKTLSEMVFDLAGGQPLSAKTIKMSKKSVLPIPTTILCWMINRMVSKQMKEKGITEEAAFAQPFSD